MVFHGISERHKGIVHYQKALLWLNIILMEFRGQGTTSLYFSVKSPIRTLRIHLRCVSRTFPSLSDILSVFYLFSSSALSLRPWFSLQSGASKSKYAFFLLIAENCRWSVSVEKRYIWFKYIQRCIWICYDSLAMFLSLHSIRLETLYSSRWREEETKGWRRKKILSCHTLPSLQQPWEEKQWRKSLILSLASEKELLWTPNVCFIAAQSNPGSHLHSITLAEPLPCNLEIKVYRTESRSRRVLGNYLVQSWLDAPVTDSSHMKPKTGIR